MMIRWIKKYIGLKTISTLCLTLCILRCSSQGYESFSAISLGSRGVITLAAKDSVNFTFTVRSVETFSKTINSSETDRKNLFNSSNSDCIEFVFCNGTYEDGSPMTFLFMKNWYDFPIEYRASINFDGINGFKPTSVMPLVPKALSREDWSFKINKINFSWFKKREMHTNKNVTPIDNTLNKVYIGTEKAEISFKNLINLIFTKIDHLTLTHVALIEQNMKSRDITPDYYIGLGEGIYPNRSHFKLETPKTYERIEDSTFTNQIEYYYTKHDGSVKAVLFEWNETENSNDDFFSFDENANATLIKFQRKFDSIEQYITRQIGKPDRRDIESARHKDPFRDDVIWKSDNGIVVYMFMFGNENQHYRQIRLAIYKE